MGNILNSHAARPQLPSTLRARDVWALRWMIIHRSHSYALDDHPPLSFICVGWSSKVSLEISGNLWKSLEYSFIFIHMRWMIIHRFHSYALDDHPKYLWKYLLLFIYLCDYWGRADIMLGFLWFLILILDVYPVPISLIDRELLLFSSCRSYEIAIKERKLKFPSLEELL